MTEPSVRVLQVTARFYPDSGGIETHVNEVAKRLASHGIEATVLATDRAGRSPRSETVDGVRVERCRAWPRGKDYYFAPGIWRRVVSGPERLVHVQGVHTLVPIIAMLAAWRAGKPYVVTFHTGGHSKRHRNWARRLQFRLLSIPLRHASLLIGVSRFERELFQEIVAAPDYQMRTIRNGGSLETPTDAERTPSPTPLLLSVGRLERYKGHQRLIEAMPHLLEVEPASKAVILGSGPYEAELKRLAQALGVADAVEITFIPGADRVAMARRMLSASAVLLLSEYEAHPVAVMEAVTLGVPVLVSVGSGFTELVEEGFATAIPAGASAAETAQLILQTFYQPPARTPSDLPTWDTCASAVALAYADALASATQRARGR